MNSLLPPDISVRTDLWDSMNVKELCKQRDLIMDKIGLIQSILGDNPSQTLIGMYTILQNAFKDIGILINHRSR